jgi:hypothetical protein
VYGLCCGCQGVLEQKLDDLIAEENELVKLDITGGRYTDMHNVGRIYTAPFTVIFTNLHRVGRIVVNDD